MKTKAYIRDERRQKNFSLPREVDEVGHENFLVHFGIFGLLQINSLFNFGATRWVLIQVN